MDLRNKLHAAVAAWDEAEKKSEADFVSSSTVAHDLLITAGGYATTSPNAEGFCQDWHLVGNVWPGTGVARSGTAYGGTGPHAGKVAPHETATGDRIAALDRVHRSLVFQAQARRDDVKAILLPLAVKHGLDVREETTAVRILFLEGVI